MDEKKIIVVGSLDQSLLNFRGTLLRAMTMAGHRVVGVAPSETATVPTALQQLGVRFEAVRLVRTGLNPARDIRSLFLLKALFRRERPDVVLSYTIKPVIYGSLAAHAAGVPHIFALITGLGAAFHTRGIKGRLLRTVATFLYRLALNRCTRVVVQNQEIAEFFIRERLVLPSKVVVVPGSGVDTARFAFRRAPAGAPCFLLLARMLRDKGIVEYVEASRCVKEAIPAARFLLVGDVDSNPEAISASQLEAWRDSGVVDYRPAVTDVRSLLATCTVYVLPSYHEGVPRSVLEAMATGRPVITTDTIGCRETVLHPGAPDSDLIRTGENGVLVPVRSVQPLAAAMLRLSRDPEMCLRMGRRGREIAEQRFEVDLINGQMLRAMGIDSVSPA